MSGQLHGTAAAYLAGCRCPSCTQEWARVQTARNTSRRERLAADPTLAQHGLSSTYTNWGCRCRLCTTAATVTRNKSKVRKKVAA